MGKTKVKETTDIYLIYRKEKSAYQKELAEIARDLLNFWIKYDIISPSDVNKRLLAKKSDVNVSPIKVRHKDPFWITDVVDVLSYMIQYKRYPLVAIPQKLRIYCASDLYRNEFYCLCLYPLPLKHFDHALELFAEDISKIDDNSSVNPYVRYKESMEELYANFKLYRPQFEEYEKKKKDFLA